MTTTDHPTQAPGQGPATEAGQDVRDTAERTAEHARDTAHRATTAARDAAQQRADAAKGGVADEVSDIAHALRTAAEDMRSGSPQERTFGMIAESLADASEQIRGKDLGEIARDLSDFARRNPVSFLGGAALAGFAATRFAKASSSPRPERGTTRSGRTVTTHGSSTHDTGANMGTDMGPQTSGATGAGRTPSAHTTGGMPDPSATPAGRPAPTAGASPSTPYVATPSTPASTPTEKDEL